MPRRIRQFFSSKPQPWKPSEETSILVGLPAVVGIAPWIPPVAYMELCGVVHREIEKLETTRHNRMDPLFEDMKLSNTNRPLVETLQDAKHTVEAFKQKQWKVKIKNGKEIPFAEVASQVANQINKYMGIIAPIAEATPFGAPVVWSAFNMLLKMASDDAKMASILADFIDAYMDSSEIYSTYWQLYRHSQAKSAQKVRDVLTLLEEDVRKFTEGARKYYFSKNAAARIIRSAVSPFAVEFQPICDGIKDRTSCLRLAVDAARQDEEKRRQVLDWISKIHYQDAHTNAAMKRVPDTCDWLRKKEAYLRWITSPTSAVLWVHGKAGFGKTILMSSVVDSLREILPRGDYRYKHVAYFYCNHDKPETLDTSIILASILKQIVSSIPEIPDKILGKFEHQKYLGQPSSRHSLVEVKELLLESLKFVPSSAQVFIVIDGLDECEPVARSELIDLLLLLVAHRASLNTVGVKLALFSRSYEDIRECLGNFLEIPIQKTDNMDDMVIFMSSRISSSRPLQSALQSQQGLRTQMITDLVNNSGGMFLWINLQQETICRERDARAISQYLKDLPNSYDMEETYRRIVAQIANDSPGNRRLAETVLGWVLCAVRPLSVTELTDVLGFLNYSGKSREGLTRDIIYSCHGLIDTEKHGDQEHFRFVHFSAYQFLQGLLGNPDPRGSLFDKQGGLGLNIYMPTPPTSPKIGSPLIPASTHVGLNVDTLEVQKQMAETCIDYLCQRALNRSLLPNDEVYNCHQEFDALVTEQPFVLYASHAWVQHYRAVEDDMILKAKLLQLFKHRQNLELSFQLFWFQKFVELYPRGSSALHVAAYFGLSDMISTLLAGKPGNDEEYIWTDNYGRTPVYWAAFHGDIDSLQRFGISMTRSNGSDHPKLQQMLGEALLAAIEGDQSQLVGSLLACGANPNSHTRDGKGALFHAAMKGDGNLCMVRCLIEAGAVLDPAPPNLSPLEAAAMTGSLSLVTYFLGDCGADVNVRSHQPFGLPLRSAVISGHAEMVKLLLESGADIVLSDEAELLELASMFGDQEIIGTLLQHAPSHNADNDCCPILLGVPEVGGFPGSESNDSSEANQSKHSQSVSLQAKTLRIAFLQSLRIAKMSNLSQDALEHLVSLVQNIIENKFTNLDFAFLEAVELEEAGMVQAFIEVGPTALIVENVGYCFADVLIYMVWRSKIPAHEQFIERLLKILSLITVKIIDGGCGGHLRTVRSAAENNLTGAIEKRQSERMESHFARIEMWMQIGARMTRHSFWLRGCAKTFLAGIMEMGQEAGIARFSQFLEGMVPIGLNPQARHGPTWRKMVAFIEIGYCAFAYGYKMLYPKIHLKIAELRKPVKDGKIQASEAMMGHLTKISEGGRGDWEWDADESPWWHKV